MSFDKVKAMRNAERFLAQSKIRAAINEYKRVIEHDPKDFSTLNMLGDLYAKSSEENEAVKCFTQVAEHYSKQGFAQKAIAIYNKISRLTPDSLEVSAKLAQLYQIKGSVAEARSHYNVLADQYTKTGRKAEALLVWTQIAKLDPSNTEICLKIADAYKQDEQKDEAVNAYIEAGKRLSAKTLYDSSVEVYAKALEIKPDDLIAIRGFIDAQMKLGYTEEAAQKLEELLEKQPYNREIIYLLVDCYIDMGNFVEAEKALIKLVQQEPSSYPKCLDLVKVYLKENDLDSASRIINIVSEHLLVGGQAEELEKWISEVLAKNPEQIEALRMLVRYHSWQRDESELKIALERLAEAANIGNSIEDERSALSQLIMIAPQNVDFARRLQEINSLYGNPDASYDGLYQSKTIENEVPTFESYAVLTEEYENDSPNGTNLTGYEEFSGELHYSNGNGQDSNYSNRNSNETSKFRFEDELAEDLEDKQDEQVAELQAKVVEESTYRKLSEVEEYNLQREIESVDFYIAQGYKDLAEKTLNELEAKFGKSESVDKLRAKLNQSENIAYNEEVQDDSTEVIEEIETEFIAVEEVKPEIQTEKFNPMDEFRAELGAEETENIENDDYETHYQMGTAYKEMGLIEEAIREFQDAIKSVNADDGTRRFFLSCNMLGHCFVV
jgi:tetratricopeptide (TPR) repeat protein